MNHNILSSVHARKIKNTRKGAIVSFSSILVCHSFEYILFLHYPKRIFVSRVYVSTRAMKHMYDKKPAEEYDFAIKYVHLVLKYPHKIYMNKSSKRGRFIFQKRIKGEDWVCSLEKSERGLEMVTCFRVRKKGYLDSYKLLWSWEGGCPPS